MLVKSEIVNRLGAQESNNVRQQIIAHGLLRQQVGPSGTKTWPRSRATSVSAIFTVRSHEIDRARRDGASEACRHSPASLDVLRDDGEGRLFP